MKDWSHKAQQKKYVKKIFLLHFFLPTNRHFFVAKYTFCFPIFIQNRRMEWNIHASFVVHTVAIPPFLLPRRVEMLHFFLSSLVGDRDSVSDRTMPSGTLKWQASLATDGRLLFSSSDTETYSACVKFCVCTECSFKFVYFLFKCILYIYFFVNEKKKSGIRTV